MGTECLSFLKSANFTRAHHVNDGADSKFFSPVLGEFDGRIQGLVCTWYECQYVFDCHQLNEFKIINRINLRYTYIIKNELKSL